MPGNVRIALASLALAVTVAACGGGRDETAVPSGPFDAMTGEGLYAQACATCHGADLRGTDQGPPFLHPYYEPGHHPDAAFLAAAMAGVRAHHWDFGNMPPIKGITEDQVRAIIAHVREQQRAAGE